MQEFDEERIREMTGIIVGAGRQEDFAGEIREFAEYLTSLCEKNNEVTAEFVQAGLLRIIFEPINDLQHRLEELEKHRLEELENTIEDHEERLCRARF